MNIKNELKKLCQNQEDDYNFIFDDWLNTISNNLCEIKINLNYFENKNVPNNNICEMLLSKALNINVKFVRYTISNMNLELDHICYITMY